MAAHSKGKKNKKWRSILLITVVVLNRAWVLDKSCRKSNKLYFRVADCRPANNTMNSFTFLGSKIGSDGAKCTQGGCVRLRSIGDDAGVWRREVAQAAWRCGWHIGG